MNFHEKYYVIIIILWWQENLDNWISIEENTLIILVGDKDLTAIK